MNLLIKAHELGGCGVGKALDGLVDSLGLGLGLAGSLTELLECASHLIGDSPPTISSQITLGRLLVERLCNGSKNCSGYLIGLV